jgi:predicted O-linked N-acetylglucosamine transferase (SPINDLY family)
LAACDKAFQLDHDFDYIAGRRLQAKLEMCQWTNLEAEVAQLLSAIRERKPASAPFVLLAIPSTAAEQLQCAKSRVRNLPAFPRVWRGEAYSHDRIRVAYVSSDLYEHAIGYLTVGLFENHDRSRFEVTAIFFGPERDSDFCRRVRGSCEHFLDCRSRSDKEVAELIRQLEIDIVVDLNGFTRNARPAILARRPAPIQVSYIGYLGTMGAEFIDYVIADEIALPFDQQEHYTENIVHLPDCFLVNDNRLAIAPHTPSRAEVGLPAEGFVFCSFNSTYKLGPPIFKLWMRLLSAIEGSVLWLVESDAEMAANLRREAQQRGIDPGRIVFAPRIPLGEHLARQRLADLFLDTTPYNAGATGAAALWSGLPVLTVTGETFVGRMAASMLHAVGLPELATPSLEDYEALALRLAREPSLLASVKAKLARNRDTYPLFDTARFTRNIETAYTTMWQRHRQGEPPAHFAVKASD